MNKFISLMDGIRSGIASSLTPRCHRSDSLSIVSRQSDLRTLLLCLTLFFGVGQMWGTVANYTCTSTSGTIVSSKITWKTSNATWNSPQCRMAANSNISFTLTGVNVTKVVMGMSSSTYVGDWSAASGSIGDDGDKTVTWEGTAGPGTLTFTTSAAARLKTIAVTYTDAASYTVVWTINPAAGGTLSTTSGNSTTVTPDDAYTYDSPAYTVTSGTASVLQSTNTFTATPTANCTIRINMVEKPKYKITYNAGTGSCETKSWTQTVADESTTLPTATTTCTGWSFAGWCTSAAGSSETNTTSPGDILTGSYTPTGDITLYAVYTKSENSSTPTTESYGFESTDDDTNWEFSGVEANTGYHKTGSKAGKIARSSTGNSTITFKNKVNVTAFSFQFMRQTTNNNYNVYIETSTDKSSWSAVETYAMSSFSSAETWYAKSHDFDGKTALYVRIKCYTTSAIRWVDDISITYTGGSTTYYMSSLVCCSPLGQINGSVSCTSGTAATLSWGDVTGAESYKVKVPGSSSHNDWTTATSGVSVTGLTAGQNYTAYFKAFDSNGSHCTEGPESTKAFTTPKITVTGSPAAMSYNYDHGPSAVQSFTVAAVGMAGNVTVAAPTNFEVSTSNNSGFGNNVVLSPTSGTVSSTTIYVRLKSGLNVGSYPAAGTSNVTVSGNYASTVNVAVSGTVANPCSAAPTVSAATSSAKTMTSITVNCAGLTALGTGGCTVDHYGFVYGTTTAPKHPSDNSGTGTVKEVGTTYTTTGTAFGATTITGLTKATKYYIRPYAHNDCGWAYGNEIEVTTLDLKSLSVTAPTKVAYFQGETFASAGAVVTVTYTDDSQATVTTSATWDLTTLNTTGAITATASYTENGSTKTATTTINVYSVTVNMVKEDGETPLTSGPSVSWTLNSKTIAANEGSAHYAFKQWNVSGATAANTGNASTTLSNPTANVTATAVFYNPRTVTKGTGTGTSTFTISAAEVKYNSSVTVTCAAADGYKNPWTLTVTPSDGATYSESGSAGSISITNIVMDITVDLAYVDKGCTEHAAASIIGNTDNTSYSYGPVNNYYKYSARQILYKRADLNFSASTKKGTIKSISFQYAYSTAMTKKTNVKIYMANTTLDALALDSYVPFDDFEEVYSGALNCSNGWNEIELTKDFKYNGLGNLAVLIDDNSNQYETTSHVFYYHSATGAQIHGYYDSGDLDPSNVTSWNNKAAINYRPNTKFCIEEEDMVPATVTLMDNSATLTEESAGAGVTLPSRDGCTGYTFAGWTKSWVDDQEEWTTTAPTIINAGSYYPSSNENLYPVYTKTEGGGSGFKLSLNDGGTDYYVGPKGSGNYMDAVTNEDDAVVFTFADGYLSFDDSGTKTYISSEGDNTTLTVGTSTPSKTWTESGTTTVTYQTSATGNRYLGFNNNTDDRFAPYGSTYPHAFTKHPTSTTSYISVPGCCETLGKVSNVSVTPGRTSATVSWNKLTNASGYEYKLGNGEWTDTEVAGNAASPSITLSPLSTATSYAINIRATGDGTAYCAEGTALTNAVQFKTLSRVTAAVNEGVRGTAKVSLTNGSGWADYVDAADGTTIYLQATPSSASWTLGSWGASSGAVASNQLTGWTGDVTVTANFAAAELPTLGTPTNMASTPTAISATLTWDAVANASTYAVTCEKTSDHSTTGIVIGSISGTSCTVTGLSAGTGYTWTVQAIGDNVNYQSGTACADQNFTTVAKKPTAISITTPPTKTTYLEGEDFDATGLVVSVTYNTGESDGVYTTISPSTNLAAGTTKVTISATLNETTVTVDQAIMVRTKYVLTFLNNGVEVSHKDLYEGAAYGTLPTLTAENACDGTSTTFMGWTTESILEKQEAAPASYASATDEMGTADVVLNAVWANASGQGGYRLVTTPTANKTYIFVASNAAGSAYALHAKEMNTSTASSGVTSPAKAVTVSSGTPVYVGTEDEELEFVFADGKYSIVSREGYYFYMTGGGVSRRTTAQGSWDDDGGLWAKSGGGTAYYLNLDASNPSNVVFKQVASTDNRVYAYEKQEVSYADYLTHCCSEWSAPAISYSTPAHWKAGDNDVAVTVGSGDTYGDVSFESSDDNVLTVDAETGAIHAVAMGTATVTATWAGGEELGTRYCSASSSVAVAVSGIVTVTFNGNDATSGSMSNQEMYYNEATALSANAFSKTGYTFYGWAETEQKADAGNRDYAGGASVTFTSDKTLYAAWTINKHAVTLNQPTGNTIEATGAANLASVAYGTEITLSATENDGYVFTGWSVTGATVADASEKSTTFSMPDNDVTVTATYSTYEWIAADPRYTVTTDPKIEYYKVEKFSTAGVVIKENFKRSDDNTITKQETYEGAWTAKLNGVAIANGADLSLEDNGKTLKLYIGEVEIASYTLIVNDIDVDLFEVGLWDIDAPTFQTGTYTMPSLADQTKDDSEEGIAACKDHNLFVGWTTDPDDPKKSNITAGGTEGIEASNTTYYAVWGKTGTITDNVEKNTYIEADKNGATLNTAISYTTNQNGSTTGPGIYSGALRLYQKSGGGYGGYILFSAASGYTITAIELTTTSGTKFGYGPDKDHLTQGTVSGGKVTLTNLSVSAMCIATSSESGSSDDRLNISAMTVYYETTGATDYITDCVQRYTLAFYADDTYTDIVAEKKYKENAVIEMPDKYISMSKDYHTFAGWKSFRDEYASVDKVYEEGDEYTVTGDDFIYGVWTEFTKGIVIAGEDIDEYYATQSYTLPTAPSAIEGKKFIGWSDGVTLYDAETELVMPDPAVDIEYTAAWIDLLQPSDESFTDGEWILVTAQDQLHAGDFIVVAAANADYALGANGGNNCTPQAVTKSGNKLSYTTEVHPLFLQNGYGANQYAFYDMSAEKYLYAASSTSNYLRLAEDFNRNGSWLITIADGNTSVIAQGSNEHNIMQYTQGAGIANSVFSCYYSAQKPIALYRWIPFVKTEGTANASEVMPTYEVNLVVQTNTSINMDAARTVNDFYIEAMEGQSGQVKNPNNLTINGNAYYDLTLNTSGKMDNSKWYAFAVPFQVDAASGIQRLSNDGVASTAVFNGHYVLLKYNSAMYAENKTNAWEYVTAGETLYPGNFYMIALNSNAYNRVRMTKKANTPLNNKADLTLATTSSGGSKANMNALANNALAYANVSASGSNASLKVQVYNSATDSYTPLGYNEVTFTVGTPFLIQAAEAGTMSVTIAASNNATIKAPAYEALATEEFEIHLGADVESYYDILYVSASEDAINDYQIGHDLAKAGISTTVPQMYVPAYGEKLCDAEFPLVNNEAIFPLTFTAPAAGTYQLYIAKAAKNAELYLQRDGNTIWNLTTSAYALELPQGTTENYSLLLKAVDETPTGLEQTTSDSSLEGRATKVVINEHVYILRGGQMYDVTGKAVK